MPEKIAILTNFQDDYPGYSLVNIVSDQITMLTKYGHEVTLFVSEAYNSDNFRGYKNIRKVIPFAHLKDYTSIKKISLDHLKTVDITINILEQELKDTRVVFSHDWIFTGWNLPYAKALMELGSRLPNTRWFHWIHSIPSLMRDWWDMRMYSRAHRIVYPNAYDKVRVVEQFRGTIEDVRVVHHIKDLRTWWDFGKETMEFLDKYPKLMQADVVQVYPASVDRLETKRVREVILMFSEIKKMGKKVCLVICNQWATGTQQKQSVEHYKKIARRNNLIPDEEVIFTSDFKKEYEKGISQRMVRELMQCSNVFIFPTREESFGLVVPEAGHAGVLMMLNKSLGMMTEVGGMRTLYADFGSYHQNLNCPNEAEYLKMVAYILMGRMKENEAIATKTFMRQAYNYDYLYHNEYLPMIEESKVWQLPSEKRNTGATPMLRIVSSDGKTKVVPLRRGNQCVIPN